VIAMTANARIEERERCHLAGVTDFVAKPFHPPTLIRLIAHICHSRGSPMHVSALAASDAAVLAGAVQCGLAERGGEQ
jgi:CheY-like chemotaxis protein